MADRTSPLTPLPQASKLVETVPSPGLMPLAMTVVVVAALYFAREILIPITLALLLTFVLAPLVTVLRRLKLGRVPSTIIAVLFALGIILGIGAALGTQVAQLAQDLPRYQATIHQKIELARDMTFGQFSRFMKGFGTQATPAEPRASAGTEKPEASAVPVEVREPAPSPLDLAEKIVTPVLGPLANLGIILVVTIFVLLQRDDLRDRLIRLMGSADLHRTTAAMDDAARRLSKYFLTQLALNASFGLIVGAGLFAIGVPSFLVWGIFGMLMRFVPYVGAIMSALPPLLLAAAVDPGWSMVAWTAVLFIVVDLSIGQLVEPLVYGHSTGLSPVAVVVSAIFWTWLWGSMGLLLSTPLTLCLVVLGRHVEQLEFIDVILGDRPPLTPVQSFYQRMLAGDPDEIVDYAEVLLKQRSLSSYYDEVAMNGLRLAAEDAARGVLTPAQFERINETIAGIIADLDGHDDVDPAAAEGDDGAVVAPEAEQALPRIPAVAAKAPPREERGGLWAGEAPVLCIAGRGPLDFCAAQLLAQLLEKHDIGAAVVAGSAASSIAIRDLDMSGAAALCVCSVSNDLNVAGTRSLLRRLRQRHPSALILTGFRRTGSGEEGSSLVFVGSLRSAVQALVEACTAASVAEGKAEVRA